MPPQALCIQTVRSLARKYLGPLRAADARQGEEKEKITGLLPSSVCRPKEPSVSSFILPSGPSVPRFWGCWPPGGTRNTAVGLPGVVETSFVALQLGHSSLGNCGVRRYTAQVSEEETEAQARSLLSAGSLCGAVLLTRAIWVAWDELEGVGLEVPAARPVHSHLCKAGSQRYGNDKMLSAFPGKDAANEKLRTFCLLKPPNSLLLSATCSPSLALQDFRGSLWLQTPNCNSLSILNKGMFAGEISNSLFQVHKANFKCALISFRSRKNSLDNFFFF